MATPADVVAGEVIEVEWGNDVRDWACFSFEFGGASDNTVDSSITTTFENGASVTFTKPTDWVNYKIMAWGSVVFNVTATTSEMGARVSIDGNTGTALTGAQANSGASVSVNARHSRTGLTGNAAVIIQYNETAGTVTKQGSVINFVAFRTS